MSMEDPYGGTPKYSTASDIYEALCTMSTGEEIGILGEMFEDISWDGQDYYYTDNAGKLVERWDELTEYNEKQWLMDVAVFQIDSQDPNDFVYEALCNDELAKRIGFKKLFTDIVLRGDGTRYKDVSEAFEEELHELDRFDFYSNFQALSVALESVGYPTRNNPYRELCSAVHQKLSGLRLEKERQLIAESRAMLTSYDDFMFGLRANQQLYTTQETAFANKVAALQERYDRAMQGLLMAAQAQGIALELSQIKLLEGNTNV